LQISATPIESSSALNPLQIILDAGPVSIAVLVILFVFSLVSWAIILSKWTTLRRAESHSDAFLEVLWVLIILW
jgi:hypothetical protein